MKKAILTYFIFFGFLFIVKAQDPHFSQFFSSPLTLNPALTGKFDGTLRLAINYRNQWPAFNNVYTTSTVSVDFPILQKILPENDTWGVGVMGLTDQSGGKILTNNYFGISTSYHKALNENGWSQIGVGFQGMYGSKRLDRSKLYFSDQLTPNGFDLTTPSADLATLSNVNVNYLDVNAGIIYTTSTTDKNNFYIGASMYHINRPKESFQGGNYNLASRTAISAGGYFPVGDNLILHTSGIYQVQSKSSEIVLGGAIAANINNDDENPTSVYAGAWMRISDALIPYLGLEFNGIRIGATYDYNFSTLKAGSQSRGGTEISLIYIKRAAESKGVPCPKF